MCDFVSWIEQADKTILFLTDKDIERLPNALQEGPDVPPEILAALQAGRMANLARLAGKTVLFPPPGSHISPQPNEIYYVLNGDVFVTNQSGGDVWGCGSARVTSTNQSGGYVRGDGSAKITKRKGKVQK
jgi:hypothetical protein